MRVGRACEGFDVGRGLPVLLVMSQAFPSSGKYRAVSACALEERT